MCMWSTSRLYVSYCFASFTWSCIEPSMTAKVHLQLYVLYFSQNQNIWLCIVAAVKWRVDYLMTNALSNDVIWKMIAASITATATILCEMWMSIAQIETWCSDLMCFNVIHLIFSYASTRRQIVQVASKPPSTFSSSFDELSRYGPTRYYICYENSDISPVQ